jgi:hypothetical protein
LLDSRSNIQVPPSSTIRVTDELRDFGIVSKTNDLINIYPTFDTAEVNRQGRHQVRKIRHDTTSASLAKLLNIGIKEEMINDTNYDLIRTAKILVAMIDDAQVSGSTLREGLNLDDDLYVLRYALQKLSQGHEESFYQIAFLLLRFSNNSIKTLAAFYLAYQQALQGDFEGAIMFFRIACKLICDDCIQVIWSMHLQGAIDQFIRVQASLINLGKKWITYFTNINIPLQTISGIPS